MHPRIVAGQEQRQPAVPRPATGAHRHPVHHRHHSGTARQLPVRVDDRFGPMSQNCGSHNESPTLFDDCTRAVTTNIIDMTAS